MANTKCNCIHLTKVANMAHNTYRCDECKKLVSVGPYQPPKMRKPESSNG